MDNPLRHRGWRGGDIPMHRAFRTLPWLSVGLPALILSVVAWLAAFWAGYGLLVEGTDRTMTFLLERLGLPGDIRHIPFDLPFLGQVELLQLDLPTSFPTSADWLANLAILVVAVGISLQLPPQSLPLVYVLRLIAGLQGISLTYFAVAAEHFPYGVGDHTGNLYRFTVVLIALLPAMLAGTYCVIEQSWHRRLAATVLIVGYFILSLPFKLLAHAILISVLSPLAMPVLFLIFGSPLDILLLVALYSWAITWSPGRRT